MKAIIIGIIGLGFGVFITVMFNIFRKWANIIQNSSNKKKSPERIMYQNKRILEEEGIVLF